jgi:hypothetical protein
VRAPVRLAATVTAVLVLFGATAWAVVPVAVFLARLNGEVMAVSTAQVIALLAGGAIGGAAAARALPQAPRLVIVGAAALTAGLVLVRRGGVSLPLQAQLVAAAIATTALGVWLAPRMPQGAARVATVGFLQVGVVTLAMMARDLIAPTDVPLIELLAAFTIGGAVAVRLVPLATIGDVAMSWLAIVVATLVIAATLSDRPLLVMAAALGSALVAPVPVSLAALGAYLARRAAPPDPLPEAALVTRHRS